MITESAVFLLFCLRFFFSSPSFVLLSSVDSVAGCFAALSISSPYSRCLTVYFWLSFIWRLAGGRVCVCVGGEGGGALLSFIQVIYCGFQWLPQHPQHCFAFWFVSNMRARTLQFLFPIAVFNLKKQQSWIFSLCRLFFWLFFFPLLFGARMIARTFPLLHLTERYSVLIKPTEVTQSLECVTSHRLSSVRLIRFQVVNLVEVSWKTPRMHD